MNKSLIMMLAGGLIIALGLVLKFAGDDFYKTGKSKIYIPHSETSGQQSDFLKSPNVRWEKIAQHYTPSKGIKDWQNLQSTTHWRKGYSAYEIAHSWENANPDLPEEIKALFGGTTELLAATPEHKTPLPGGSRPSQTDVLAFIRTDGKVCAVAVEGKADENFGQTVGAWLKNASAGKIERLKYISEKLGLRYPPADNIRYQLLHRAASAVIEAERFNADCAAMVIHSFSREQKSFRDFGTFLGLFGIRSVGNDHLYTSNKPGIPLSFGWVSSKRGVVPAETATRKFQIDTATIILLVGVLILVAGFWLSLTRKNSGSTSNTYQKTEPVVTETTIEENNSTDSVQKLEDKLDQVPEETGASSKLTKEIQELHSKLDKVVAETKQTKEMLETMDSKTKLKEIEDKIKEIEKIKDKTPDDESYKKGLEFEGFVVNTFDKKNDLFELLNWSGDKITSTGVYPKDATDPDLIYEFSLSGKEYRFAVECKWRSGFSYGFAKDDQLKNYKEFEKREGLKTFIVLGVGGKPDDPERVFIMPVNEINKPIMSESELKDYEQYKKTNFFYDFEMSTLSLY